MYKSVSHQPFQIRTDISSWLLSMSFWRSKRWDRSQGRRTNLQIKEIRCCISVILKKRLSGNKKRRLLPPDADAKGDLYVCLYIYIYIYTYIFLFIKVQTLDILENRCKHIALNMFIHTESHKDSKHQHLAQNTSKTQVHFSIFTFVRQFIFKSQTFKNIRALSCF